MLVLPAERDRRAGIVRAAMTSEGALANGAGEAPFMVLYGAQGAALYVRRVKLLVLTGDVGVDYAHVRLTRHTAQPTDGTLDAGFSEIRVDSEAPTPTPPALLGVYSDTPATFPEATALTLESHRVLVQVAAAAANRPAVVDFDFRRKPIFLGDANSGIMVSAIEDSAMNATWGFFISLEWFEGFP